MNDSIRSTFKYPDLVGRSIIRIRSDEEKEIMNVSLEFDFKNIDEVNSLLEDIQRGGDSSTKRFDTKFLGYLSKYSCSKKTIERTTEIFEPFEKDEYAFLGKAMFATARIKTIYHVPGKIVKVTVPGALVESGKCEVDVAYTDFYLKKKSVDGSIRFR
jgi:hypothetical protein